VHHWCKSGENPTNTFQDIMLTSPESVVSCILYSTVNLTFWPQIVKRSSLSHTASLMQIWWKCVKYSARYSVNNVSGRTHRHTHGRTGQKQYPVSSLPGRRCLRSSFTSQLLVPPYRLSTVGRRSFPIAASIFWNTLPDNVQSAPSVSCFRQQLKTFLFHQSFPDIIL